MAQATSKLGLTITAKDNASAIFTGMAAKIKEAFNSVINDNERIVASMERLSQVTSETASKIVTGEEEMRNVISGSTSNIVSDLREQSAAQTRVAEVLSSVASKVNGDMRSMAAETSKTSTDVKEELRSMGEQASRSSNELDQSFKKTHIADALMDVGMYAEEAGEKVTGFFERAAEDGMDFDQKITAVVATLNSKLPNAAKLSKEQIEAMSESALEMGKKGFYSANEIGEGLYALAQQGLNYDQIMGGAMESVQNLAVATDSDLGTTAATVTDIFHEMGAALKKDFGDNLNDQFTGIANSISGATHNARMSMDDFLNTMKYVGPQAGALGLSVKDVSTAIALFAEHGIRGSQAGTTLRRTLSNLIPATDVQTEKLKKLGFITKDGTNLFVEQNGKLKSLADIHDILYNKLSKLTDAERQQAVNMLFGQYAMAGMTIYTEASSERMQELSDELYANASASELAAGKWDNTKGRLREFNAHVATIVKQIGADLEPAIDRLISAGQSLLAWFDSLSPTMRHIIEGFALFVGSALSVIGVLFTFGGALGIAYHGLMQLAPLGGMIASAFSTLMTPITWLIGGISEFATACGIAFAEGEGLIAAIGLVATPVGIAVTAIAALGLAFYVAYNHCATFREGVNSIVSAIGQKFTEVKQFFFGKDLAKDIEEAGNASVKKIVDMSTGIESKLITLKATGGQITADFASEIVDTSAKMRDECIKAADERCKAEIDDATYIYNNVKGLSTDTYHSIVSVAEQQKNEAAKKAKELQTKVTAEIEKMRKAGVEITDEMKDSIIKNFQDQRDGCIAIASDSSIQYTTVMEKMKLSGSNITSDILSKSVSDANATRDGQIKAANDTYDKNVKTIVEMRDKYHSITRDQAEDLLRNAEDQKNGSINSANEMHTKVIDEMKKLSGESVGEVDWSTGKIKTGWDKCRDNLVIGQTTFNANIKKAWDDFWTNTKNSIDSGLANEKASFTEGLGQIKTNWSNVVDNLKTGWSNFWSNTKATGSTGLDGLRDAVRVGLDLVKKNWNQAWEDIKIGFKNQFKNFTGIDFDQFYSMGSRIITSLTNGIKSMHIPTPEFSFNQGFSLTDVISEGLTGFRKAVNVRWNAVGGIMTGPTIFGAMGNTLLGGGEAGPEAILPLSKLPDLMEQYDNRKGISTSSSRNVVNNITIHVNGVGKDGNQIGNDIGRQLRLQMSVVSV